MNLLCTTFYQLICWLFIFALYFQNLKSCLSVCSTHSGLFHLNLTTMFIDMLFMIKYNASSHPMNISHSNPIMCGQPYQMIV